MVHLNDYTVQEPGSWVPLEFWREVYHAAFPTMDGWAPVTDPDQQRLGIDRYVYLRGAGPALRRLAIDEKIRTRWYGDVLLEYVSNNKTGSPGWIAKSLHIDYVAYGILPISRAYLLNWRELQSAYETHKRRWFKKAQQNVDGFKFVTAKNVTLGGYESYSIAVPVSELEAIMGDYIITVEVEV